MKQRTLLIILVLMSTLTVSAYDAEINGIYYKLTSEPNEAEVTSNPQGYTGSVVIPATVTYNGAEYSVTNIGYRAFYECRGLTSVTIGNRVTTIGEWAFSDCSSLTTVTIGEGVREINSKAFAACPEITDVYCYAKEVPNTSTNAFMNSYIEDATLHVPESSITAYQVAESWSNFGTIIALTNEETSVKGINSEEVVIEKVYDLSGHQLLQSRKGVNILRYSNGKTRKVMANPRRY